jgi:GNAT superfamily N-acetyltransferase
MTETPRIRLAGPADAPAVALLVHRLLGSLLPPEKVMPLATLRDTAGRLLTESLIDAFLAEAGGEPVGLVTLTEIHAIFARGAMGELCEVYVEPGWRASGLAGALIERARAHGRARGWSRLELSAPLGDAPGAERAYAFYRRLGFVSVGPRLMLPL